MIDSFRALCGELVEEFDDLRESSEGVAGFHANGDLAPWDELSESGRFPWLATFDRARALLAQPEGEGLMDEELANAAREALDGYRYSTELPYFLEAHATEHEPFMLALRAAIAADRARCPTPQPERKEVQL